MIEAVGLTKSFGSKTAVYNLTFQVQPGKVTGFLGPNGAGKSTTMRMILGLDAPTGGTVTIGGYPYRQLPNAPRQVGALLDANAKHGGRSARAHLTCLAQLSGIPSRRVDEVLGVVGLQEVAKKRSKGFSLGMGQRLGIAAALLGDPQVLLFDEPVNGLDPEGILWIRTLMRRLAAEGRTVFVSSHLMSEMAQTADHLIVIGRGQLMADMPVREFIERNSTGFARVRTPEGDPGQRDSLNKALTEAGGQVQPEQDGALKVFGLDLPRISDIAHGADVRLWELSPHTASLEEAYMRMTQGAVDFRSTDDARAALAAPVPAGTYGAGAPVHPGQGPGAPAAGQPGAYGAGAPGTPPAVPAQPAGAAQPHSGAAGAPAGYGAAAPGTSPGQGPGAPGAPGAYGAAAPGTPPGQPGQGAPTPHGGTPAATSHPQPGAPGAHAAPGTPPGQPGRGPGAYGAGQAGQSAGAPTPHGGTPAATGQPSSGAAGANGAAVPGAPPAAAGQGAGQPGQGAGSAARQGDAPAGATFPLGVPVLPSPAQPDAQPSDTSTNEDNR
ncbi:ATP-binding cassette domain-containing protein [Streptomyces sp. B6B3]|uniref:ATP-binding cassette domain-containing protein n=1 Tax=Streptomyces sp. B6B3 TaxID=3153570 RepID=UPI00325F3C9D